MMYGLTGDVGSGKTLKAIEWMQDAVNSGRFVASSIQLTPACPFYKKVALIGTDEWPIARTPAIQKKVEDKYGKKLPQFFWEYLPDGAIVFIDECQLYFNSNDYKVAGPEWESYHTQHRKMKQDVIYMTQQITNLYKRIRDLCGRFIVASHTYRTVRAFKTIESVLGRERALRLSRFCYWEFSHQSLNERYYRGQGYYSYGEASKYFGWYDTHQLLGDVMKAVRPFQLSKKKKVLNVDARPGNPDAATGRGTVGGDVDVPRGLGADAGSEAA
jgi:hypothetical protein